MIQRGLLYRMDDADGAQIRLFDDGGHSNHLRLYVGGALAYLSPAQAAELAAQITHAVEQRIPEPARPDEPVAGIIRARRALHRAHLHAASRRDDPNAVKAAVERLDEATGDLRNARTALMAEADAAGGDQS